MVGMAVPPANIFCVPPTLILVYAAVPALDTICTPPLLICVWLPIPPAAIFCWPPLYKMNFQAVPPLNQNKSPSALVPLTEVRMSEPDTVVLILPPACWLIEIAVPPIETF